MSCKKLSRKEANNKLPAARTWKAGGGAASDQQAHCIVTPEPAENSQVGCVSIRQSAAGAVTVKTTPWQRNIGTPYRTMDTKGHSY